MSEYTEVERPFLQQLAELGWTVIDQGTGVPQDAAPSLRVNFRQWLLPDVFDRAVRAINRTDDYAEVQAGADALLGIVRAIPGTRDA